MSKKTLIIIIAAVLVVILAAVGIYFGFDKFKGGKDESSNPSTITSSTQDVQVGEVEASANQEVSVAVKVGNNPGFAGYDLEFTYDSKSFSFVKCENGLVSPLTVEETADGVISVIGVENGDLKESGTLFTLVFKAKQVVATGEYEIKTTKAEFANWDEKTVETKVAADKIIVK